MKSHTSLRVKGAGMLLKLNVTTIVKALCSEVSRGVNIAAILLFIIVGHNRCSTLVVKPRMLTITMSNFYKSYTNIATGRALPTSFEKVGIRQIHIKLYLLNEGSFIHKLKG